MEKQTEICDSQIYEQNCSKLSDWDDSWKCLEKNPQLKIADETTSEGREVLSVYLHLLDFIADPSNEPRKARGSDKNVWSAKNDWSVAVVMQLYQWAQIELR